MRNGCIEGTLRENISRRRELVSAGEKRMVDSGPEGDVEPELSPELEPGSDLESEPEPEAGPASDDHD